MDAGASGAGAGPPVTDPSEIENLLAWRGQTISASTIDAARQPWWVQTAVKAMKVPAFGWVMTTFWSAG